MDKIGCGLGKMSVTVDEFAEWRLIQDTMDTLWWRSIKVEEQIGADGGPRERTLPNHADAPACCQLPSPTLQVTSMHIISIGVTDRGEDYALPKS